MRKLIVILSVLLVSLVSFMFVKDKASAEEEWIEISTPEELNDIRRGLSKNYKLVNDIDLSDFNWNPIGTDAYPFMGKLDGNGYSIKNLKISTNAENVGLFGHIKDAEISNLVLENPNITNNNKNTGALAGKATGKFFISHVGVEGGKIYAQSNATGGLIGLVTDNRGNVGEIIRSYVTADVESTGIGVGGLVGEGDVRGGVTIKECYFAGNVTNTRSAAGGIMGSNSCCTRIENSYSTGNVTAKTDALNTGGIIGRGNLRIINVYSIGEVRGGDRVGGFIGLSSTYSDNYYWGFAVLNPIVEGKRYVGKVIGMDDGKAKINNLVTDITPDVAMKKSTYVDLGWEFGLLDQDEIWAIDEGETLPYLVNNPHKVTYDYNEEKWIDLGRVTENDDSNGDNGGDGSSGDDSGSDGGSGSGSDGDSDNDDVGVGIGDGGLKLTTSPIINFGNHIISKDIKTIFTSFERAIKVEDLRGTHEGWRLDLSATSFKVVEPENGFKEGTTAHELPKGSFAILPPSEIKQIGGSGNNLPISNISGKTVIDSGTVTLVSAEKGTGTGEFDIVFPENALSLVIDPETVFVDKINYPNTYTPYKSTLTWNLVSAP